MSRTRVLSMGMLVCLLLLSTVQAFGVLPPPRSFTDGDGHVYLGGQYIELGINKNGAFGTPISQPKPAGFFGTAGRTGIGMSSDPDGLDNGQDLRMDFFLPGTPEERWVVGYVDAGGTTNMGSNVATGSGADTPNGVVNISAGNLLSARSTGTFNNVLLVEQTVSFRDSNKYFRIDVRLSNVGATPISRVRYMRSVDPDNTVDVGGDYITRNEILAQYATDTQAMVVADTAWTDLDPVWVAATSRAPFFYFSRDPRARVSTWGFGNSDPYEPLTYDAALPKGTVITNDQAVTITFDAGTLAPGASATVTMFTSLDPSVQNALDDIQEEETTPVELISFTAASTKKGALLKWATATEWDNLGFNIYRSATLDGVVTRMNGNLIVALGTAGGGQYEFLDPTALPKARYFYWLEDVSTKGETELHGPAIIQGQAGPAKQPPLLASFGITQERGLYRIRYEDLVAAGADRSLLDPSRLQVFVGKKEVPVIMESAGSILRAGDEMLFFAPAGRKVRNVDVRLGTRPSRMAFAYAAPADGAGEVWHGSAAGGSLAFATAPVYARYLLSGFKTDAVYVLDVTDGTRPALLFGYALLAVGGENGIYLSYAPTGSAKCLAVSESAIRPVRLGARKATGQR